MENDKSQRLLEVGGRMIPIAPSQWRDSEMNMAVAKALTPEEGQRVAQMMLMLHSTMSQDPQMQMLYGVSQKHALFDDIFDAIGVDDTTRYMMRPDSPEFQQAMVSMQQNQQQQAQKQEELRQFQMGLMMSGDRRLWEEFNWKVTNEMDDNNREDRKLDHQMVIDEEELDIERNQKRAANIGGGHS
jgi:hypothetical protein